MNFKVLIVFLLLSCLIGALSQELCVDSCPVNEVFSDCNAEGICQRTCSTRNGTIFEDECPCTSGCVCKSGYFRDENTYKCIMKASCPPIPPANSTVCAKNEVYSKSLAGCQKDCYNRDIIFKCIPKSGCICADGYIRSPINNQCILMKSCDKCPIGYNRDLITMRCELSCVMCMDSNAEYQTCGDRCKELTCENPLLEGIVCPAIAKCEPGCFCKPGYVKDSKTKKCIPPKSCPNPCTDINAEYSNCGSNSTCDTKTCRFPQGQGGVCIKVCQKGCFCKPDYVKNEAGKCVLPRNCPILPCLKNEINDCRNPSCEPGCLIKPCLSVNCEKKCYCKDGFVKENGICVLLESCKKCDDPNSEYSNCKTECSVATCLNSSVIDPLCKDEQCVAGCFCKNGYVKDHTGKCVVPDKCPKCPYNESFSCGSAACEMNCGNLNETCIIQDIKCDNKCFCNKDFVRETPYGPCIPISKCPLNKCKINEVFECRNPTCDDEGCCIEKGRPCKDVPCENKCYCADGFVRINGLCVPRENCNQICSDPNSTFKACQPTCEPTCKEPIPSICPIDCVSGCVCNDGYIRDANGACIPNGTCPKLNVCPLNEVFECRDPKCGEKGCFDLCKPDKDTQCVDRCFCADGFVRINGTCVPRDKCNEICSDPNSTFNSCGTSCESTCDKPNPLNCPKDCVRGCFCNKDYIKDSKGICIPIGKCPQKCPANEIFTCASAVCEKNCKNHVFTCDIVNVKCVDKCFCIDGYVRKFGPNGPCIPVDTCPPYTAYECADRNAVRTCLSFIPPCQATCNNQWPNCGSYPKCVKECECKDGFIRTNFEGPCIPIYQCPVVEPCPQTCPENETCSCQKPDCQPICNVNPCVSVFPNCVNGCNCKPGFIRAYRKGPCVKECESFLSTRSY